MTGARTSLPERSELVRILSQAPEASAFQGAWRFRPLIQSSGWRDPASTFPQRPNFSAFASATQYLLHGKLCRFPFMFLLRPILCMTRSSEPKAGKVTKPCKYSLTWRDLLTYLHHTCVLCLRQSWGRTRSTGHSNTRTVLEGLPWGSRG